MNTPLVCYKHKCCYMQNAGYSDNRMKRTNKNAVVQTLRYLTLKHGFHNCHCYIKGWCTSLLFATARRMARKNAVYLRYCSTFRRRYEFYIIIIFNITLREWNQYKVPLNALLKFLPLWVVAPELGTLRRFLNWLTELFFMPKYFGW